MNGQESPVDFGVAVKGTAAPQLTFKVVNTGGRALELGEIKVPTGFALVERPGASLAAGASDTFVLRMDTAVVGAPGGFISIASSDADEHPFTFAVTGTVIARTPPASTGAVTLRASAYAHVQDGSHAGKNFGAGAQLHLKKDRTGMNRDVYLKFDLASLPAVGVAKLRMFGKIHSRTERPVVGVYPAAPNANWSESGLTWKNRPAVGTTALATVTIDGPTGKWYEFDVTSYLRAQHAAGAETVTLVMRSLTTTTPYLLFNSDEAASNRPALVVTPPAAAAPTTASSASQLTSESADDEDDLLVYEDVA